MIVDIHTHTFPDKIAAKTIAALKARSHTVPFTDGTVSDLLKKAADAGISLSVILPVATSPGQVRHINDSSVRINEQYDGKGVFSAGAIHPDFTDYREELKRIFALGLKGIKVHPVYQGTDLDDIRYLRIFDEAASLGLFVITHTGLDIGYEGAHRCTPAMARHVAENMPHLRLVLAHMGGWLNWDEVTDQLADTSVLLDTAFSTGSIHKGDSYWDAGFGPLDPQGAWKDGTSMLDEAQFMELFSAFGADRILFGTDSPWGSQAESLAFMRSLPVSANELEKMLGANAAKLLGL